jgi:CheY-like chemotaxis protein
MFMTTQNKKITWLIDDDVIYLFGMKKLIETHSLSEKVIEFHDGQAAIDFLDEYKHDHVELPDVIFVDINMPVMNGWEFVEEFVKLQPNINKQITVYMVSSSLDKADIERAKSFGAISDYVIKPVNGCKLKEIYESLAA